LDAAKGAVLASSPWLLGFAKTGPHYWLPHVLLGASDVLAALTSKSAIDKVKDQL
jgi:hypothetical protein